MLIKSVKKFNRKKEFNKKRVENMKKYIKGNIKKYVAVLGGTLVFFGFLAILNFVVEASIIPYELGFNIVLFALASSISFFYFLSLLPLGFCLN